MMLRERGCFKPCVELQMEVNERVLAKIVDITFIPAKGKNILHFLA
jgi:hypothetical protein